MLKDAWRGRYYEDFEVGDLYRHRLGRTGDGDRYNTPLHDC